MTVHQANAPQFAEPESVLRLSEQRDDFLAAVAERTDALETADKIAKKTKLSLPPEIATLLDVSIDAKQREEITSDYPVDGLQIERTVYTPAYTEGSSNQTVLLTLPAIATAYGTYISVAIAATKRSEGNRSHAFDKPSDISIMQTEVDFGGKVMSRKEASSAHRPWGKKGGLKLSKAVKLDTSSYLPHRLPRNDYDDWSRPAFAHANTPESFIERVAAHGEFVADLSQHIDAAVEAAKTDPDASNVHRLISIQQLDIGYRLKKRRSTFPTIAMQGEADRFKAFEKLEALKTTEAQVYEQLRRAGQLLIGEGAPFEVELEQTRPPLVIVGDLNTVRVTEVAPEKVTVLDPKKGFMRSQKTVHRLVERPDIETPTLLFESVLLHAGEQDKRQKLDGETVARVVGTNNVLAQLFREITPKDFHTDVIDQGESAVTTIVAALELVRKSREPAAEETEA